MNLSSLWRSGTPTASSTAPVNSTVIPSESLQPAAAGRLEVRASELLEELAYLREDFIELTPPGEFLASPSSAVIKAEILQYEDIYQQCISALKEVRKIREPAVKDKWINTISLMKRQLGVSLRKMRERVTQLEDKMVRSMLGGASPDASPNSSFTNGSSNGVASSAYLAHLEEDSTDVSETRCTYSTLDTPIGSDISWSLEDSITLNGFGPHLFPEGYRSWREILGEESRSLSMPREASPSLIESVSSDGLNIGQYEKSLSPSEADSNSVVSPGERQYLNRSYEGDSGSVESSDEREILCLGPVCFDVNCFDIENTHCPGCSYLSPRDDKVSDFMEKCYTMDHKGGGLLLVDGSVLPYDFTTFYSYCPEDVVSWVCSDCNTLCRVEDVVTVKQADLQFEDSRDHVALPMESGNVGSPGVVVEASESEWVNESEVVSDIKMMPPVVDLVGDGSNEADMVVDQPKLNAEEVVSETTKKMDEAA